LYYDFIWAWKSGKKVNNYLEDRSKQKNEFIFFDSRKFLDSEEDFIDQAHLSVIGAKKVANYLNKVINNLN
jgi:ribosomal protein L22